MKVFLTECATLIALAHSEIRSFDILRKHVYDVLRVRPISGSPLHGLRSWEVDAEMRAELESGLYHVSLLSPILVYAVEAEEILAPFYRILDKLFFVMFLSLSSFLFSRKSVS